MSIVRAYRDALGIDLQALVNADMQKAFAAYPKRWGLRTTDRNIDHRRVPNLQMFLARLQGAKRCACPTPGVAGRPEDICHEPCRWQSAAYRRSFRIGVDGGWAARSSSTISAAWHARRRCDWPTIRSDGSVSLGARRLNTVTIALLRAVGNGCGKRAERQYDIRRLGLAPRAPFRAAVRHPVSRRVQRQSVSAPRW